MIEIKKVNNIEYAHSRIFDRIWVAKDGSYIIPDGRDPDKVRQPTPSYNKKGTLLQMMICSTVDYNYNGKILRKQIVKNAGRIVFLAWNDIEDNEDLVIDHIDRDPSNNNLLNLRLVTQAINQLNRTNFNPTWLHSPEVNAKRNETNKNKRLGITAQKDTSEVKTKKDWFVSQKRAVEDRRRLRMQKKIESEQKALDDKQERHLSRIEEMKKRCNAWLKVLKQKRSIAYYQDLLNTLNSGIYVPVRNLSKKYGLTKNN